MFAPSKAYCYTATSSAFPATVKHKACLRSCHGKQHPSREQVAFLFSKRNPMACRTVSCSLASVHHLQHLAALQHAAAARWKPTTPSLSWATQSCTVSLIILATTKKTYHGTSIAKSKACWYYSDSRGKFWLDNLFHIWYFSVLFTSFLAHYLDYKFLDA